MPTAPWPPAGRLSATLDASRDTRFETEADQTGGGEDDGVVIAGIELGQAGVDVAAQELDLQIRTARQQLAWRRRLEVPTTLPAGSSSSVA